ncbi:hypothetical protein C1645_731809 [Glomus cerebriforme]|uniref:BACK domain-containing protein n=1 Tax=Glomus cerebriforme TaxID=658196 RepID=A0A397TJ57_9GLOM|nr:hypothetical protein C1645_731809 [Glomus cerebriforme]
MSFQYCSEVIKDFEEALENGDNYDVIIIAGGTIYLIENEAFLYKDPVSTLQVVNQHEPFEGLKDYCQEIISEEPRILFSSEKFPLLEKSIITMVLQRDDLNMEEIDIWESLLRWIFVHYQKSAKMILYGHQKI